MNAITTTLTFRGAEIKGTVRDGEVWLGATQIGLALDYANPETAITKIYNRHADEFSSTMTTVVKLATVGGKQLVRLFSLRGAHLLAMFARTDKAKAFRRWVLDILDRQAGRPRTGVTLTPVNLTAMCQHMEFLGSWWAEFGPGIRALNPAAADVISDRFVDGASVARNLAHANGIEIDQRIKSYPWREDSFSRMRYMMR